MQLVMIVSTEDVKRAIKNLEFIEKYISVDEVVVIGNEETGLIVEKSDKKLCFLREDTIYPGMNYNSIATFIRKCSGKEGRTGWYLQQFLKMAYAFVCKDDYYLVWDGDTIPVRKIELFDSEGHPFMALKEEYNKPYFDTMEKLFGFGKEREESFISEHMLIHTGYMKEMIEEIGKKADLVGEMFFEKILSAVVPDMLSGSGFSEYETYGTYVTKKHPELYKCISYSSCRHTVSMIGLNPSAEQIQWLAGKYEAISFEKWDSPIKGLTKMSEKEWFRKRIGLEIYDKICKGRCEFKFWYQRTIRKIGRPVKRFLKRIIGSR